MRSARTSAVTFATGDEPAAATSPPARIGRYIIEGVLGAGGMAIVYLARDPSLDRSVALKVIRGGNQHAMSRLIREGQAIARISHPNVIHVYEVGREDGLVYIAMERIEGVTLDEWLRGGRTRREVLDVFASAGRGLAAAHAADLVHRDFKPENVIVGNDGRVRVLDFGLARSPEIADDAKAGDDSLSAGAITGVTAVGAVVGTPAYMSPEQWRGEATSTRSDQFSFCVALARGLAGEHPFDLRSRASLREAVMSGHITMPRSIPRRLRPVLLRGMATDPADRFPSINDVVDALARRRPRWPWFAAAALVLATLTTLALARDKAHPVGSVTVYSAPVRLTTRGDVGQAAVSPDGRRLALVTRDALVVQALQPDAEQRVLLRGRFAYKWLAWSPDGTWIALNGSTTQGAAEPGLIIVHTRTAKVRHLSEDRGRVALLPGDELVAAKFGDTQLAFYDLADTRHTTRTCPLPQPFAGIRSVRFHPASDSLYVQLDRSDQESVVLRIDRACTRTTVVAGPLPMLSFSIRARDARILARLFFRHDLAEIGNDGQATTSTHVIQSSEYVPLAIRDDGAIVHVDRSTTWQLATLAPGGSQTKLISGTAESRFAVAIDGVTVAQVVGVYRQGLLRVGRLDDLRSDLETIATGVARVAWSPDGSRLAVLRSPTDGGYTLAIWDRARRVLSPPRPVPLPYDAGMIWLDNRRVGFATPHDWEGIYWIDPDRGDTGTLAITNGESTKSLARAHRSHRLAFVTGTPDGLRLWTSVDGERPRLVGTIPAPAPRKPHITWSADDHSLIIADGLSGNLWSVRVADGAVESLPGITLDRAGGFTELTQVFALPDRLLFETLTRNGDVFLSRPIASGGG